MYTKNYSYLISTVVEYLEPIPKKYENLGLKSKKATILNKERGGMRIQL